MLLKGNMYWRGIYPICNFSYFYLSKILLRRKCIQISILTILYKLRQTQNMNLTQIRLKHLPQDPHKTYYIDRVKNPRVLNCRFRINFMLMEDVRRPLPKLVFDGSIFLKITWEKKVWKYRSYYQYFFRWWYSQCWATGKIGGCRYKVNDNTITFF